MHRFKFSPDDLFINRLKTYPEYNVFIYQSKMHVNKDTRISGSGGLTIYDVNRNLTGSGALRVYPLVETGSKKNVFKKYKYQPLMQNFFSDYAFISKYFEEISGNLAPNAAAVAVDGIVTSSYGFESPITRKLTSKTSNYQANFFSLDDGTITTENRSWPDTIQQVNVTASALQNIAKKYTVLSDHFNFQSSSTNSRDLVSGVAGDNINFVFIPNMYYGSSIKKGSVELNYYITGSKIASCADIRHNGTLIGTTGSTSGSVVGLVMYDEGIIMLTSSNAIETVDHHAIVYDGTNPITSSWLYYGTTLNDGTGSSNTLASASYDLNFKGTSYVNTMTMFAHAKKGHLNHSNNPTYRDLDFIRQYDSGSGINFYEGEASIANVVSASYVSASFEKTTYISKVHIYDEDGNLIAITSMAKPVKKTLNDEFTFKMKLDL